MTRRKRGGRPKSNAFRRLPPDVRETQQAAERQAIRADALARYARLRGGAPVMCQPPPAVAQARVSAGLWPKKPKVIFKSLADAEAFAEVVAALDGKAQTAYQCEYSRTGHAHLTSDD